MLGRYSTALWLWVIFTDLYLFWKIKPLVVKSPMYFSLEIPPPLLVWLAAFFPHFPHSVGRPFAGNLCQTLSAFFRLIPLPFVWIMLRLSTDWRGSGSLNLNRFGIFPEIFMVEKFSVKVFVDFPQKKACTDRPYSVFDRVQQKILSDVSLTHKSF